MVEISYNTNNNFTLWKGINLHVWKSEQVFSKMNKIIYTYSHHSNTVNYHRKIDLMELQANELSIVCKLYFNKVFKVEFAHLEITNLILSHCDKQ